MAALFSDVIKDVTMSGVHMRTALTTRLPLRRLVRHDGRTARTPFQYHGSALAQLRPDQIPRAFGAVTEPDRLETRSMRFDELTAVQNRVDPAKVAAISAAAALKPAVVVHIGRGRNLIMDGHHRLVADWLKGEDTALVRYYDVGRLSNALKREEQGARVVKVDDGHGLVFGYAIICKKDGEDYFDLQGDHIPEDAMLGAAVEFMEKYRTAKEMHLPDGALPGSVVFAWPLTTEIAGAFDLDPRMTGLLIGMKPDNPAVLAKFRDGTYTGFSIGGSRITDEEVEESSSRPFRGADIAIGKCGWGTRGGSTHNRDGSRKPGVTDQMVANASAAARAQSGGGRSGGGVGATAAGGTKTPEQQITDAYNALRAQQKHEWVSLTRLRSSLSGMSREEVDAGLRQMSRSQRAYLVSDSNQKTLTHADRQAALHMGGEEKHLIAITKLAGQIALDPDAGKGDERSGGAIDAAFAAPVPPAFKIKRSARAPGFDHGDVVRWYRSGGHAAINEVLRDGAAGAPEVLRNIALMHEAVACGEVTRSGIVYRPVVGADFDIDDADEKFGKVITWRGFTSATTDERFARRHLPAGGDGVLFRILLPQGARALQVAAFQRTDDDAQEVILPAGARFVVREAAGLRDGVVIDLVMLFFDKSSEGAADAEDED